MKKDTQEVAELLLEDRLYKAICDNNWEIAKALLEEKPYALTSTITASRETPFHVAAFFGHANIMKELLKLLGNPEFLEALDESGSTPLLTATATGSIEVAKCPVDKNSYLLCIPYYARSELPVTLAFVSGHHEMGRYLYSQTPLEYLQPLHLGHPLGPTLLRCCLQTECFDIDANSTPSFQSASLPIQNEGEDKRERKQGKLTGPGIKKIKEMKLQQAQANELLDLVCRNASKDEGGIIAEALFLAAKEGNVQLLVKISNAKPEILLTADNLRRSIFYYAIEHRRAGAFNLIHERRFNIVFPYSIDRDGNTLLHAAAAKASDTILNRIYGPALQMQRELQWFKVSFEILMRDSLLVI
ncbi:serine/threonine-protein phosphatase 6 regulatory ankyrin repeat subunit B-like [Neltuma alba]|uniref:serine/threonine-protein phosphatase 6 regulatory ankyrin repeat subunit B-like n=1 Tax=Neltuma alba TaxID=207710 RepID=UPI0010A34F94|nr:serine/threonine-protein phosphatase 6 regulatory ankyrin repeat subunit B-like [Prosopis alba]